MDTGNERKEDMVMDDHDEVLGLDDDKGEVVMLGMKLDDGSTIEVPRAAAIFISDMIRTALSVDEEADSVHVPGITHHVMTCVVQYMLHHFEQGEEPKVLERDISTKDLRDYLNDTWDGKFINRMFDEAPEDPPNLHKVDFLYRLAEAANPLGIQALMNLVAARIVVDVRDAPHHEIARLLNPTGLAKREAEKAAKEGDDDEKME